MAQPATSIRKATSGDYPSEAIWLRGVDLNHRPLGYEPNELPDCSTPRNYHSNVVIERSNGCGLPNG